MTQGGFFEQRSGSPSGFALVVAMHAAALGALVLIKGPEIVTHLPPTIVRLIPETPDPPEVPPPPPDQPPPRETVIDRVRPLLPIETTGPRVDPRPLPPLPPTEPPVADPIPEPRVEPVPVRVEAEVDPRHAGALQPPYPPTEQRAEREGTVRIRITIGVDGRVKAAERVSATSDAFWSVTERQALSRWRFRPATLDGRPVESRKTMTVHFRIER